MPCKDMKGKMKGKKPPMMPYKKGKKTSKKK